MATNDIPNTEILFDDQVNFAAFLFNFAVGKFQLLPDHEHFLIRHHGIQGSGWCRLFGHRPALLPCSGESDNDSVRSCVTFAPIPHFP